MPKPQPEALRETDIRRAIFEEGCRVSGVTESRIAPYFAEISNKLTGVHALLRVLPGPLWCIVTLLAAIAVKLWFF